MLHENRQRAESFGADAERYDRSRPSYPAAMVDDLLAGKPARVLDVGCGTGMVARLFLARGCDVLGVEPDSRMASIAESHGIQVEVASFEAWDPARRTFDLVVAGQAWHWVDPSVGPGKAAALLGPGGWLAIFWNRGRHDTPTRAALDEAYLWAQQYSRDEWLDQLGTHSDHIALEPQELATLLHAVGAAIDRLGGSITLHYETQLISAQRAT